MNEIHNKIKEAVKKSLKIDIDPATVEIVKPEKRELGDLSSNIAFKIAKNLKKTPREVAEIIKNTLKPADVKDVEIIEAVNGYINFYYSKTYYQDQVRRILKESNKFADSDLFKGKKVQIEFISANPTGPLTLANGRGGFAGDTLANVFAKAGANVEREYYVNNTGNQIKVLGESILASAGYLKEKEELYRGRYIDDWINKNKEKVKKYKNDPYRLGQIASKDILEKLLKPSIKKMKINFDSWFSEEKLEKNGEVEKAIESFSKKGLTYKEDGALWFKTSKFNDTEDRVLIKSDGEKTYFANDTAYHWDKFAVRKFDKVVNFWGADHHGYVERLQAATEAMGFGGRLNIVIMQLVRLIKGGQEYKMSKRKGTYVTMDDLLELIGGPEREASDVARFFFVSRSHNTHMDFDLDLAKERSEKNPVFYVKYAYARLSGILRNASGKLPKADLNLLVKKEEIDLIDQLVYLETVLEMILSRKDNVALLPYYSRNVAEKFHVFYEKCRVIDEKNPELTAARLELVKATKIVLGIVGKDLIGIDMPEKM